MMYMLDTNMCIYLIRRRPSQVLERFRHHTFGDIGISAVTLAELHYGVAKSQFPERNRQALEAFTLPLEIVPFDSTAAAAYGPIRAALERQGTPIGAMDMLIAAHALSLPGALAPSSASQVRGPRAPRGRQRPSGGGAGGEKGLWNSYPPRSGRP